MVDHLTMFTAPVSYRHPGSRRADAEIIERLFLAFVIEHDHQLGYPGVELDPLVITKCFAQGMGSIVTRQIDDQAPGFDQPVDRGYGEDC
jgi:hypothetical protein